MTSPTPEFLASLNTENWNSIGPAFQIILDRPVSSKQELESLIVDWSTLRAYVDDTSSQINIAASLDAADTAAQTRKRNFLVTIQPNLESASNQFAVRVLELNVKYPLSSHYELMIRVLTSDRDIFREENTHLNSKAAQLAQDYDTIMGNLRFSVAGTEFTPPQVNGPMNTADRSYRESLWRGLWDARKAVELPVEDVFTKQIALRHRIARNAGFDNFRDYAFQEMRRFYYTAEDAKKLHASIAELIVPVARDCYRKHLGHLSVASLKPWDIGGGRFHEIFVKPYLSVPGTLDSPERVVELSETLLQYVNDDMVSNFRDMQSRGEVDLAARPGKGPGAYQTDFPYKKRPFIFGNNSGVIEDIYTTLHEFGHAYHYLQYRNEPVSHYRQLPMEAAELGSMACELMGHRHLEECFDAEHAASIRADKYEGIALFLCYMAQVDSFQHWLYENPEHTVCERRTRWCELTDQFGPVIDWEGIESFKGIYWHQQLHLFRYPFYYIEYGIAQLGALQVEANYVANPEKAVTMWRDGLRLGGSRPLPEIYATAGIRLDFSRETLEPVSLMLHAASA